MIRIPLNCLNWALYYIFALALNALQVKKKISKVTPNPYHSERNVEHSWPGTQINNAQSRPSFMERPTVLKDCDFCSQIQQI